VFDPVNSPPSWRSLAARNIVEGQLVDQDSSAASPTS
jgi:hypothetical protein